VRLGDIAEVRRGFTTGANEFFYLDDEKIAQWGIEKEFVKPVIKSPRECKSGIVNASDCETKVLLCSQSKRDLKNTNTLKYIEWGEKEGFHQRPTCASREKWWDLGVRDYPTIIWVKSINESHRQSLINGKALVDQRLYEIYAMKELKEILAALLNTTMIILFKELTGRVNLGEGALDTTVYEANKILIPEPNSLSVSNKGKLVKTFKLFSEREMKSVFVECGLDPEIPIRSQQPNPLPDRKALDDVVFDALGLTEAERKEVYWAVCELVQNRLKKARSV
jgi:hypothetical protein